MGQGEPDRAGDHRLIASRGSLARPDHQDLVVALTSFSDRQRVNDMLAAGAIGYLLKDSRPDDLLAAVRAAADGHAPLDPRVAAALLPGQHQNPPADLLSEREKQVLRLAAQAWRTSRSHAGSASARAR